MNKLTCPNCKSKNVINRSGTNTNARQPIWQCQNDNNVCKHKMYYGRWMTWASWDEKPTGLDIPNQNNTESIDNVINLLDSKIDNSLKIYIQELNSKIDNLEKKRIIYGSEGNENPVYQLALKIYKKIPIIYSDVSSMRINAVRLKGQINENGKMLAYNNDLPELNHNEIVGWQNNPEIFKYLCVLWLEDDNDNNRTKIRKNITEKILDEVNIPQYSIQIIGESFQERFLHMIHYGDWLSFWCAILHETDPSPVEKIVRLKNELSKKS